MTRRVCHITHRIVLASLPPSRYHPLGITAEDDMMRVMVLTALLVLAAVPASADDVADAIEQGRRAYSAGDLSKAKEALDLASQLIGQKNAEAFGKLLPAALAGWKADEVQTTAVGSVGFGVSTASRRYEKANGDHVEIQITGDSAVIMQFATMLSNPQIAGAMGKIVMVGSQRALQSMDGDVHMVISNKYLIAVQGNGSVNDKLAYARAIDVAKLSKM